MPIDGSANRAKPIGHKDRKGHERGKWGVHCAPPSATLSRLCSFWLILILPAGLLAFQNHNLSNFCCRRRRSDVGQGGKVPTGTQHTTVSFVPSGLPVSNLLGNPAMNRWAILSSPWRRIGFQPVAISSRCWQLRRDGSTAAGCGRTRWAPRLDNLCRFTPR